MISDERRHQAMANIGIRATLVEDDFERPPGRDGQGDGSIVALREDAGRTTQTERDADRMSQPHENPLRSDFM